MAAKTRLAKIEKGLTPQQVVLAYLDEIMRRFSSFFDWTKWAVGNPSEAPLIRVSSAAREAVRCTVRGWPKDAVARAEDDAVRESMFLVLQRSLGSSEPVTLVDIFFQNQWLEGESTWISGRFKAWGGNWSRF